MGEDEVLDQRQERPSVTVAPSSPRTAHRPTLGRTKSESWLAAPSRTKTTAVNVIEPFPPASQPPPLDQAARLASSTETKSHGRTCSVGSETTMAELSAGELSSSPDSTTAVSSNAALASRFPSTEVGAMPSSTPATSEAALSDETAQRIESIRACLEARIGTQRFERLYRSLTGGNKSLPRRERSEEAIADDIDPNDPLQDSMDLALVTKFVAC